MFFNYPALFVAQYATECGTNLCLGSICDGATKKWRAITPNCGFQLVQISVFEPINKYTPFNFAVKDLEEVRTKLEKNGVTVSELRNGEPKRFDLTDNNGNMISVIQV